VVQVSIILKFVNYLFENKNFKWLLTRTMDASLSYVLCEYDIPSGLVSRPSRIGIPGENDPPIDHVSAIGSPVKAIAMTASAAPNSGPRPYAASRPAIATMRQQGQITLRVFRRNLLWGMLGMPLWGRNPWFAAAFKPGHGPRSSVLKGATYSLAEPGATLTN
jgi:hypothetical protein